MGFFISIEGADGTGKTTQVELLGGRLTEQGYQVVIVQEPGGTELGNYLRDYLKSTNQALMPEAELFLFVASRSELVRRVIGPALNTGSIVIADRYADSTTAYQGYGRRLPMRTVKNANDLATGGIWPDVTLLLDAPSELALDRAGVVPLDDRNRGRPNERDHRRFEEAGISFHRRVRKGYLKIASKDPNRVFVLNASLAPDLLAEQVWQSVAHLLMKRSMEPSTGTGSRLPGF